MCATEPKQQERIKKNSPILRRKITNIWSCRVKSVSNTKNSGRRVADTRRITKTFSSQFDIPRFFWRIEYFTQNFEWMLFDALFRSTQPLNILRAQVGMNDCSESNFIVCRSSLQHLFWPLLERFHRCIVTQSFRH